MELERAYGLLYTVGLILLGLALLASLVRAIRGPRTADRVMGVNMMGSLTIMALILFSRLLEQDWLLDVALIYAMISFISLVVLTRIFVTVYLERKGGGK